MPTSESTRPDLISSEEQLFSRYLVLPTGVPLVLSLYTVNSYLWDLFDNCAYLAITSPTKRCGKTTLAQMLAWLCRRAEFTVDPTGAATFHIIADRGPTLICDEAENYLADRRLRPLLNAGFKKGLTVPRCIGGQIVQFAVFGPKIFCIVGEPPESLLDRSIVIAMRRAKPNELTETFRENAVSRDATALALQIADWAAAKRQEVADCYANSSVDFLPDREANLWAPLFAIAQVVVPERIDELKTVALRLIKEKSKQDSELSPAIRLLMDLRTVFASERAEKIPTDRLIGDLRNLPDRGWKWISGSELARHLRPFSIEPKQMWMDGRNVRGYLRRDFLDAFERYVPAQLPDGLSVEAAVGDQRKTDEELAS